MLTNFHVIKGADEITVRLSDKREYRGKVMGTDPKTDLAVVRFDPDHELRVAALGELGRAAASASGRSPSATRSAWTRPSRSA